VIRFGDVTDTAGGVVDFDITLMPSALQIHNGRGAES